MKLKQVNAYFFLVLFVFESFWPTASMALTYNPVQPEFAAYEDMNTTDMVNTITGDFTYSLPILNVPSPEGGFQMPLAYHGGIEMEEESSWTGLGWGLNPGALNRNVSVYPDDYDGSQQVTSATNIQSVAGNGYIDSHFFVTKTYDSNKGYGWSFDFQSIIGFGKSKESGVGVSILGVNMNRDGVKYDPNQSFDGVFNLGVMILSCYAGPAGTLFSLGIGISEGVNTYLALTAPKQADGKFTGDLKIEETERKRTFWRNKTAYKYWIAGTETYKPSGTLYLGNMQRFTNQTTMPPTSTLFHTGELVFNGGGWGSDLPQNQPKWLRAMVNDNNVSDFYTYFDKSAPLTNQFNSSSLAYDNFYINAGGASGAITPTRLDPGSIASDMVNGYNNVHFYFCLTPYKPNKTNTVNGYKVPFRYLGDPSNSYDFNLTTNGSGDITTKFATDWNFGNTNYFQVSINDNKILNEDVANGGGRTAIEGTRTSAATGQVALTSNKELVHGKHIAWYSNDEITNSQAPGLMDCGISRSSFPVNGIGGFAITREDGLTYHFTIPVYNKSTYKRIQSGVDKYEVTDNNPYATTWLLTGITGADYVDRGTTGRIDDDDWGYWVKLDYGMYNNNYCWRQPYFGWDDAGVPTFSRGVKQTYYLNTIRTRSHTALFCKSVKNDGRSYYESDQDGAVPGDAGSDPVPSAVSNSLKLDDVYIIDNQTYSQVAASATKLSSFTYNNAANWNNISGNSNVDNLNANVLLSSDVSSVLNTITANQTSHLRFNYTYDLCPNTLNSFASSTAFDSFNSGSNNISARTGKLTLTSVDMLGLNNTRYTPNYAFSYGNLANSSVNPAYSTFKKDDFGFYKPDASASEPTIHNPGPEGDQWSLKQITTPLGATIDIEYERDTYWGVNGESNGWFPMKVNPAPSGMTVIHNGSSASVKLINVKPAYGNLTKYLEVGNLGYIWAPAYFSGMTLIPPQTFNFNVSSISNNSFEFSSSDPNLSTLISQINNNPLTQAIYVGMVTGLNASNPRYGGDLRVKNIISTDELGNKYVTRYDYNNSGWASFEGPSTKISARDYEKLYEHPYLPILYKNVTIYNGRMNGSTFEWNNKSDIRFTTPNQTYLTVDKGQTFQNVISTNYNFTMGPYYAIYATGDNEHCCSPRMDWEYRARSGHIVVRDRTSAIGSVEQVTNYNSRNEAISQMKYEYTDDLSANNTEFSNMGQYGETNFLWEFIDDAKIGNANKVAASFRLIQTSKVKYPNVLKSYTRNVGGVTATKTIEQWDYFTGQPLVVKDKVGGQTGEEYTTQFVPAYEKYPEMGSKAISPYNKNVMAAHAQETRYVDYKLLSSKVLTWSKDVNYRLYDPSLGRYNSVQFPYGSGTQIGPYHPHKEYSWKSLTDKDGTIAQSDFVDFNWSSQNQDARWIKSTEATLYDKYSRLLEGIDVQGRRISAKHTLGLASPIASLYNCGYGEWCFSSAEDPGVGNENNYFGSEVFMTNHRVYSPAFAHTGNYVLQVPSGQYDFGFHFRGGFGTSSDIKPGKRYRASVWVHNINHNDAVLYYELRNGSNGIVDIQSVTIPQASVKEKYGNWYKLDLDITMPISNPGAGSYVLFGCYSANANPLSYVYLDDFKVHPVDNPFEATVTDIKTGNVLAKLDKENIATKYYYDDASKLSRVEKETKNGFVKVSEHGYNYKRP